MGPCLGGIQETARKPMWLKTMSERESDSGWGSRSQSLILMSARKETTLST